MLKVLTFAFVGIVNCALAQNERAGGAKAKKAEDTPLDLINKEIAQLEAKMKAIEHIKMYAESINLGELAGRDIEQTVAQFVKSTRKSAVPEAPVRSKQNQAMKEQFQSVTGKSDDKKGATGAVPVVESSILNQVIGKSLTELDTTDHVFTVIPTR